MADTGSDIAQDIARSAAMLATRVLDRAIADARAQARLRERMAAGDGRAPGADAGRTAALGRRGRKDDRVRLSVMPADGVTREERAEELRARLSARDARGVTVTYGSGGRAVVVTMDDAEAASMVQETLEALHADEASSFALSECIGLNAVEGLTGRVTSYGPVSATEHVLVRFAGLRDALNAEDYAEDYAESMRRAGFDACHREAVSERGGDHVVAVSYPTRCRLDFTVANARVLGELGTDAEVAQCEEMGWEDMRDVDESRRQEGVPMPTPPSADAPEAATAVVGSAEVGAAGVGTAPEVREPREHVMAVFCGNPDRDREAADAYAERMAERGYEPWHAAMCMGTHVHHTVELSYPASERSRFAADHVDVLDAIGADAEVEVLEEPVRAAVTLEDLIEGHLAAREEAGRLGADRSQGLPGHVPVASAPGVADVAQAVGAQGAERGLTAREYLALPARERARIPAERIPDGAFGGESIADVGRQARSASRALERGRDRHIVPSIGERG